MNLKDYREQPDEGLYEKIERRLRMRRLARVGGVVSVVCVCACVAAVALTNRAAGPQEAVGERLAYATERQAAVAKSEAEETAKSVSEVPSVATPLASRTEARERAAGTPQTVQAPEPVAEMPMEASLDEDIASWLPQTVHERADLQVPAREPMACEARYIGPADDTAKADIVVATKDNSPKSGTEIPVHIDDLYWVPNVIVPGGDVAENRSFKMKFTSTVTDFHIYIYNRGGRQVYASTDAAFEWDGTYNGTAMPQGAYVWVAKFRDSTGKMNHEKGTLTIIR